jgi:hypothetical protein
MAPFHADLCQSTAERPHNVKANVMCFSATASFTTAGLTGVVGIVALARVDRWREVPLAVVPIFFAIQQTLEGFLWLVLPADSQGPAATTLTLAFLLFAEVFWPVFAPVAVWLVEPAAQRRKPMLACVAVGLGVSTYLLWWILTHTHGAAIINNHIDYVTEGRHSNTLGLAYLAATCLPMLCSSQRTLTTLGGIILAGSIVANIFYWEGFTSVWCFFAAAASIVILGHFEYARRERHRLAGVW